MYNAEKKSYIVCQGKKTLSPEVWEKVLTQTKSPIPPLKSQMVCPLLTCIFDSKEMTLIDILILSQQYANNCSSGSIFVDSVWQKTYSGGPVICVNYLKWNQSYLYNLNTPLNITRIEDT